MLPTEITGIRYLAQETPIPTPVSYEMMHSNTNTSDLYFNRFLTSLPNFHFPTPQGHEFTPQYSCISNNSSTSDEAEEHHLGIIDERKQRRMISNRESARRSRMRKQKHLDELWSQVVRLRTEKYHLIERLNHVTESHDELLQENTRLKEEASDLRQMLTHLQIGSPYPTTLRDLEEVIPCNTADLGAESSDQSISNPEDLLYYD
ncbi:hypothetical protein I3843_06G090500 [Carya illinoinensis]|uniref:BZIP domain-containing protein n=1 Tax=Carya illinoinensis TaxID=32201 RepID=A0A8T1QAB2_CARIL|nr:basic leucine zipper 43-like [Carya illinoinensis]KAG6651234.1 hypothetical protein CIPAW_06G096500 [Carya illinoinensis]KAG6708743.1 hypothetical protein I3842_06G097100 [Carya illinoinensis]KAG7975280.1 hypothetical protein I3843_06G090500 [Carya illinoinensis]